MPAWRPRRKWTEGMIEGYRRFSASEAARRAGSLRSTCEDLALRLLIEYAHQNELPIRIKNDSNPTGYIPVHFDSVAHYMDGVLTSTGASDLIKYQMTVLVDGARESVPSSLSRATRGDLILLYAGGGHVQIVTDAKKTEVSIAQGNFRPKGERCGRFTRVVWGKNQNQPRNDCYIGAIVKKDRYVYDARSRKWSYGSENSDVFSDHGRLSIWDFNYWND